MSNSSYRRMLDRGRKAGLNARELYQALSAKQPAPGDGPLGKADCNGFVAKIDANGHRTYDHAQPEK